MFGELKTSYEFGPFRVDPRERQLMRNGEVVPLRPKVFDILLLLVQNSGHVLTKDDVMKQIWSNTAVEEGNISRTISTLRTVLGEHPRDHRYIETVPWRGYRFVANVREVWVEEAVTRVESIAVLPFVSVKPDPKTEYLVDGITDSLIRSLAQSTNIRVTSRNSAFRYKGREVDAQTVGHDLKVQALVLGRVAQSDLSLSISIELIDARDDRHLWGAQYIRPPEDLLATCETITRNIHEQLRLDLPDKNHLIAARHKPKHDAHVLFLKGRYHFNKLTPDGVQRAQEYLLQATQLDPEYALAYAALSDCHNYLNQRIEAKAAVSKALALDEALGEAHATLGFYRFLYEWDFAGAEDSFKRSLALNPNYAEAHHWYAIYLANLGRHSEAEREAKRAVELDPLSLLMNMTAALNFYIAREHEQAIDQLHRVLELETNFLAARSVMGNVLVQKKMYEQAIGEFHKVLELVRGVPAVEVSVKAIIAQAYGRWGNRKEALKLLQEVEAAGTASWYSIAGIYAALSEVDSAFESLNKAYEQHDVSLVSLKVDPSLDGVRSDPRFNQLMAAVGIP
ncbi:MAG TPA: winged helix-turn-helix domain-containing protein [Pyrinomonadaceae bacterium]|nr:winged helix-turn-helix domain-containing protein [Pyrinomonadaceae bacterium]